MAPRHSPSRARAETPAGRGRRGIFVASRPRQVARGAHTVLLASRGAELVRYLRHALVPDPTQADKALEGVEGVLHAEAGAGEDALL